VSAVILPRTSDERLLVLVRAGEERAFEMVVRRYRASLVGYCTRLGLSEPRAEDAVQQCFLSALLALRRGDEVRDLRAWLGRIAHNVAVNT
jgi:RNA polymerase sigma-70 factor (ECF subfamily)